MNAEGFFQSQLEEWPLAARNYAGLSSVVTREMTFDGFSMQIQFNPERIRSSGAKVDAKSIQERPCFLCPANLPAEQKEIPFPPHYSVLVNPFPIFPMHFTIPDNRHTDQLIEGRISDMLRLAKALSDVVIFYNGPKCGASAPDHFHFQAGNKGLLPLERDMESFKRKHWVKQDIKGTIFSMDEYLRKALVYESVDPAWLEQSFESLVSILHSMQPDEKEPMMNILVLFEEGIWKLVVFPRIKHRPSQFFEEGEKQILFSPGAVDFGGLLIIPRQEDFEKLDSEVIADMFTQLTFTDEMWKSLLNQIQ